MNSKIFEVDVHGFKRLEAKKYIYSKIKDCLKNNIYTIRVIHGFNNGTVIKDWLNNSQDIIREFDIIKIEEDILNSGATIIYLNVKGSSNNK